MPHAPSIVDVPLSAPRLSRVAATSTSSTFNVTVDDYGLDIHTGNVISYNGSWDFGQTCTVCKARADPAQTYNSTWRDTTMQFLQNPTFAIFNFTGMSAHLRGASLGSNFDEIYCRIRNICVRLALPPPRNQPHMHLTTQILHRQPALRKF